MQESSDHLLQTGVNTLQKTSLLRKAVEVQLVDDELAEKREEFRRRMAANKTRKEALMRKQEKIQERVHKFDKFLKENEAKRTRALQKYQQEVKSNKQRGKELAVLKDQIARLSVSKAALMQRLDHYRKFEEFMLRVVEVLPEGFMPLSGESMIDNCIVRYEALSATQRGLVERNKERATEIEEGQRRLESMKSERNNQQLLFNQEITELLQRQEKLRERNRRLEQTINEDALSHRFLASELGRTLLAIDNLAMTCHSRHWPPLVEMTYEKKLQMIKQHFAERVRVLKLIQRQREVPVEQKESSPTKLPSLSTQTRSTKSTSLPRQSTVMFK